MASLSRRLRTREESPVGRLQPKRNSNVSPDFRSRGRSPEFRSREKGSRLREHEERRRMHWEEERHGRSRSRSRLDFRERHSRSGGRRSRSVERFRFKPSHRPFEDEFERRQRGLSMERRSRERHSSPESVKDRRSRSGGRRSRSVERFRFKPSHRPFEDEFEHRQRSLSMERRSRERHSSPESVKDRRSRSGGRRSRSVERFRFKPSHRPFEDEFERRQRNLSMERRSRERHSSSESIKDGRSRSGGRRSRSIERFRFKPSHRPFEDEFERRHRSLSMERRSRERHSSPESVKDRRSRSGGRRSRSVERFRFKPSHRPFEDEFECKQRSLSMEQRSRERHSSPESVKDMENKYSPIGTGPSQFPADDMQEPATFNVPQGMSNQMQPNGPIETSTPIIGNQEFPQNQNFGPPQRLIQSLLDNPIFYQGFQQGSEFPDVPIINNSQDLSEGSGSVIPEFNPETSKLTSFNWIRLIEETGKRPDWGKDERLIIMTSRLAECASRKDERLIIMTSRLAGFARQWYLTTGINLNTWRKLRKGFLEAFPAKEDYHYHVLLEKMMARKKEKNESMTTYFQHKVVLLNTCDIYAHRAVSCIIGGLQNAELKMQSKRENFEDPDALYVYLCSRNDEPATSKVQNQKIAEDPKNKKSCYFCTQSGHFQCTGHPNNKVMCGVLAQKPIHDQYFTDGSIKGEVLKAYVDICSETTTIRGGDAVTLTRNDEPATSKVQNQKIADDPKNKKSCFFCTQSGHSQCTGHLNNKVMCGVLAHKPIHDQYFTDASIKGKVLKAYVDICSETTTIRGGDAVALNIPIRKRFKHIIGFGGVPIVSFGFIDVALCIDEAIANVTIYVVSDHLQAIPLVVGQSFIEQPHVLVMQDGNKMCFYQNMDNEQTNFDFSK